MLTTVRNQIGIAGPFLQSDLWTGTLLLVLCRKSGLWVNAVLKMPILSYLSGWGAHEESVSGSEQSDFLAQLDVTVNTSVKLHYNLETNVGANDADPCAGDSGGPLLMRGEDRSWRLVATLLGGGFKCGAWAEAPSADKTSDWNKVSVHIPWITSIIGGISFPSNPGCLLFSIKRFDSLNVGPSLLLICAS